MTELFTKVCNRIAYLWMLHWNRLKLRGYNRRQFTVTGSVSQYQLIGPIYIRVKEDGHITLGRRLSIISGLDYNPLSRNIRCSLFAEPGAQLTLGDDVGISGASLWAHRSITLGDRVKVGADTLIVDSDCHSLDYEARRNEQTDTEQKTSLPIWIGDDVLIGARCIILKGVEIGPRSIVGAGSVVTCSIPADELWAGNPAHFVRSLKPQS